MKNLMNMLGLPEDMPIENRMISKSIETAQKKVEGHNFDIRKHLVEYDDVMNKHREVIYRLRRRVLEGLAEETVNEYGDIRKKEIKDEIFEIADEELTRIMSLYAGDLEKIKSELKAIFGEGFNIDSDENERIKEAVISYYNRREEKVGTELMRKVEQSIYLRSIDMLWIEHLTSMEELRTGIGLMGYGQRDPLVEYKAQAYARFQQLLGAIRSTLLRNIFRVEITPQASQQVSKSAGQLKMQGADESDAGGGFGSEVQSPKVLKSESQSTTNNKPSTKVGRNDPCPCGSGKKYKKCCGR